LQREYEVHGITAYQRLAGISRARIYRLRATAAYRKRNASYEPPRPTVIAIGERRRPEPNGRPGYLRIDTVHQGDYEGAKGVYHFNAVDEVTQWQMMAATPKISEWWLIPVLEAILAQFPFGIRGFHSDNGSEYINHDVARLLGKLLIEQTSRARATPTTTVPGGGQERRRDSQALASIAEQVQGAVFSSRALALGASVE
jgi:transposase InsO family protein